MLRPDVAIRGDDGQKVATLRYRTVAQIEAAIDWAMTYKGRDLSSCKISADGSNWAGTATMQQYRDMLRDGWPEGLGDSEGLEGLSTDAAERLSFKRSVGGAFPIVPAYLSGAPDAMLMPYTAPMDSVRGLTLVCDGSFSAYTASDTALKYAQSVMRLVAWLQAEQIDTSVYMTITVTANGRRLIYLVPIHETGQILQPERIAAMVHPSFLRRAWFAMFEYEYHVLGDASCRSCTSGFGQAATTTSEELRQALPEAFSAIVLPKVGRGDPMKAVQESTTFKLRRG